MGEYNPQEIEKKWQDYWEKNKTFRVEKPGEKKLYVLDMFPYPSGAGLHIGHPLGYTATDIYSRFKTHQGYTVLHPMGYDAFGLPAEQHAISTGEHPGEITEKNCENFTRQMKTVGLSYDWDREIRTCTPDYYKWTQWIFLKIYNSWFDHELQKARPIEELPIPEEIKAKGEKAVHDYQAKYRLAYYADAMVNWCPALGTVLANEEVIDGRSERGGHEVIRKPMKQWMMRITEYAERLLNDLDEIDWPESIKEQQRNWIGKAHGTEIDFKVQGSKETVTAFTTRPDTLFGVTFFVISPEHPLVEKVTTAEYMDAVLKYREKARKMSDLDRTIENRKKTGQFTGAYVVNPINNEAVPLYVGDYVLMSYGTGAVMGVPAHDERDFEFARTYQIEIRPVITPTDQEDDVKKAVEDGEMAWTGPGVMLPCSAPVAKELTLAEKPNKQAMDLITSWLERNEVGRRVVTYKLRDWVFSRQRYWGEPIPIVHWEDGTTTALDESELPLVLPEVREYKPSEGGESPLARAEEWCKVIDPKTGKKGRRETNTMPQWAGSCWYYLRFIDPHNNERGWDPELERRWMPVDLYVGGAEHAVLHLLYARFWHKVLYDLGYVSTNEPFKRLFNQGMILAHAYKNRFGAKVPVTEVEEGEDGIARHKETGEELERIIAKMSKSLRNVIVPDDIIKEYGADTLRTYLMFMGPLDSSRVWDSKAIMGNYRFLKKAWTLVTGNKDQGIRDVVSAEEESKDIKRAINFCIKKVTEDLDELRFNTAISALMEFVNEVSGKDLSQDTLEKFTLLLSPLAPHLAEELWERLGHQKTLRHEPWPTYDETLLAVDTTKVVIQVNGKKRALIEVSKDITEEQLKQRVRDELSGTDYQVMDDDRFIIVVVPGTTVPKLVNIIQRR
ncbi:MAG: leucine--tRNA ligase [Candidatus Dadabacteria bacterium]|nr:MAG: leucine--tRNA ligase [Candidatus Dadabacteria bacterium]